MQASFELIEAGRTGLVQKVQLLRRLAIRIAVLQQRMRSALLALLLLPLASAAQVEQEATETEKIRRELKLALETHFKPVDMYVLPKGSVVPGRAYRIEQSPDSPKLLFRSVPHDMNGVATDLPTSQPVMAPQAALGTVTEASAVTPPWVGLLLKRLDDIDGRVKRLEATGRKK